MAFVIKRKKITLLYKICLVSVGLSCLYWYYCRQRTSLCWNRGIGAQPSVRFSSSRNIPELVSILHTQTVTYRSSSLCSV